MKSGTAGDRGLTMCGPMSLLSVTLPEAPAVYVIVWMSVALVIVPFVIDQA